MGDPVRHVAIFLPDLGGGGGERVMVNLSKGFVKLCDQVDIVLAKARGPFLQDVPSSVKIVDLNSRSTSRAVFKLAAYLKKSSPDIVFSTLHAANVVLLLAKLMSLNSHTKYYIREANTASHHLAGAQTTKRKLLNLLVKKVYPSADRLIAVSNGVADDLKDYLDNDKISVDIIHNPVNTPEIINLAQLPPGHDWLDSADRKPVVLGVGRLVKQKNFELLVRAFSIVRKNVDARLILLGEGDGRGALESLVAQLHLEPYVSMPGFQTNPYTYMAHADVFVLSSLWEGFPNSLVEALACGCPVVSTDCPSGPAEILEYGKYGALVPLNDAELMASKIIDSLSREQDKELLVIRAQEFSLDEAAKHYLE